MARVVAPRSTPAKHRDPREPAAAPAETADGGTFDAALRGYDRRQVDERLRVLAQDLARLEAERRQAAMRVATEAARARHSEELLRQARAELDEVRQHGTGEAQSGFGYRAERILRMAEVEAGEIMASAAQNATTIIEKARAEAEHHRHEVEQQLIQRTAVLEQEATQRMAAVIEREQAATGALEAARRDANDIQEAALRSAEHVREQAEEAALERRREADEHAEQQRAETERELSRLTAIGEGVRAEFTRLYEVLEAELADGDANAPPSIDSDE